MNSVKCNDDMSAIVELAEKIEAKVWKSGCDYLYGYYDELVKLLDAAGKENLTREEIGSIRGLINTYSYESTHDNSSLVNWIWYSVRAFYCADSLVGYLPEENHEFFYGLLDRRFLELVENGRAPIIKQEVFDRYLERNLTDENSKELYSKLVRKAAGEISMSRLWRPDENELAYDYAKACDHIIRDYLKRYGDYSLLKEWLPRLGIVHVADFWYRYHESTDAEYASESTRASVDERLYRMMNLMLHLHSVWYWHNSNEMIETLSSDYLIALMEVHDDREFETTLTSMVALPFNQKVKDVLEHFANDDDQVVSEMATELLESYIA